MCTVYVYIFWDAGLRWVLSPRSCTASHSKILLWTPCLHPPSPWLVSQAPLPPSPVGRPLDPGAYRTSHPCSWTPGSGWTVVEAILKLPCKRRGKTGSGGQRGWMCFRSSAGHINIVLTHIVNACIWFQKCQGFTAKINYRSKSSRKVQLETLLQTNQIQTKLQVCLYFLEYLDYNTMENLPKRQEQMTI